MKTLWNATGVKPIPPLQVKSQQWKKQLQTCCRGGSQSNTLLGDRGCGQVPAGPPSFQESRNINKCRELCPRSRCSHKMPGRTHNFSTAKQRPGPPLPQHCRSPQGFPKSLTAGELDDPNRTIRTRPTSPTAPFCSWGSWQPQAPSHDDHLGRGWFAGHLSKSPAAAQSSKAGTCHTCQEGLQCLCCDFRKVID